VLACCRHDRQAPSRRQRHDQAFPAHELRLRNRPKYGLTARFPCTSETRAGLATTSIHKTDGQADRLDIRFQVSGYLLFQKTDRTKQRVLVTKDVRYFMGRWALAAWTGDWSTTGLPVSTLVSQRLT